MAPVTLQQLLADLLGTATAGPPTAESLRDRFLPQAKRVTTAGPNLTPAAWARRVSGAGDVFLDLDGDVAGLQLWEDSRGWGAYAEVAVTKGTLADVEAVAGPTQPMPRAPGAIGAGDKVSVYVPLGGRTVRVFAELVRRGPDVDRVTVHFQR